MNRPQISPAPLQDHRFEIKDGRLIVSMWQAGSYLYWVSFDLSNCSDDRISVEDLEDVRLVRVVDVPAVAQAKFL